MLERNVLSSVAQLYSGSSGSIFDRSPGADIAHSISAAGSDPSSPFYSREGGSKKKEGYVINLDAKVLEFIPRYLGSSQNSPDRKRYKSGQDVSYASGLQKQYQMMVTDKYSNIISGGLLRDDRPLTQFVEDAREVEPFVKDTFEKLTGRQFPDDIVLWVCTEENLMKAHIANGGVWNPGIQGFALNRKTGSRRIFVKKNNLDALMLVIGHEIGHVLTEHLSNQLDEEAKAFAFEVAWVKTIIEHDIADLKGSFNANFTPAANGLHNIAFAFVQKIVKKGKDALETYWEIVKRNIRVEVAEAQAA
jgi:hypothetical protein